MARSVEEKRAAYRKWYQANKEKRSADFKRWSEANKERRKAHVAAYKAARPEQRRRLQALYRARHPERVKMFDKRYHEKTREKRRIYNAENRAAQTAANRRRRQENPEPHRDSERKRRALKAGAAINDFTQEQWIHMQRMFKHCCAYCGIYAKDKLTQDHITPLSKGGNHTLSNIVPACGSCNSRKRDRAPLVPIQPLLL